jgi:hypothetical protein
MSTTPGNWLLLDTSLTYLSDAWQEREKEAAILAAANQNLMSVAFRIYAFEIKLKVIICKTLRLEYLPKHCKSHDLSELIVFTGIWSELDDPANVGIKANWDKLSRFSRTHLNNLRYLSLGKLTEPGSELNQALLAEVVGALDDPTEGVSQWLSRHLCDSSRERSRRRPHRPPLTRT